MIKQLLAASFITLICQSLVMAIEVPTSVSEVTVYGQGAMVTRSASVNVAAGEQEVVLEGFPSNLDPANIRIEVADKQVRIGQVNARRDALRESDSDAVLAIQAQIEAVELELQVVEDSNKAAKLQLSFLESLATGYSKEAWVGSAQANADTASWQQALNLMQKGAGSAYKVIRDNQHKKLELNKDLSLLKRQLADKRATRQARTSLMLAVSANRQATTQIKVHYQQDRASWSPNYEARLDTDSGKLVLAQKAVVSQATEEAWENVKLMLSTSEPSEALEAPTVSSQFVNLALPRPAPQRSNRKQTAQLDYSMAPAPSAMLEEVVVSGSKRAEPTWSGNYAMNFPIAGRVTVTNNSNETQRYDLKSFSFNTQLVTKVVPQKDDKAYLAARLTHDGSTPLYASEMLIYVDGVFMGEAYMPAILPGAEVTLPMGQDPRIEVTVVDQGAQDGESGVFKKQRTDAVDLLFEIVNRRASQATIEVRDAYPVAKNKSIKIEMSDSATSPTVRDEDDQAGVVMWRKDLPAGETWKIRYGYSLSYPADRRLVNEY
ncbi:mucoidy inhibitor MuiA family protein [Arenicella xantha]|uniref:Uncharacterized protein (TIGR02231 family) n=1 Tax=Arenicella xantha TaxID=644221 RepID=A0A395JSN7_9GAMM|nr:mucoidy inhibitor MuiA family protein [Arenicella xantha]RBP53486.1 uncharacterized protein (TIGR02231 family) [Arenicella xantha]